MSKPTGNPIGRPIMWENPNELQKRIDDYYAWTVENHKHITVTGLAWWLNTNRQTLINYESCEVNGRLIGCSDKDKAGFVDTIKRAKQRIEMEYEESLMDNKTSTGAIFTLKNNYAWCDKQEIVTTNNDAKLSADEVTKQLESLGYKE